MRGKKVRPQPEQVLPPSPSGPLPEESGEPQEAQKIHDCAPVLADLQRHVFRFDGAFVDETLEGVRDLHRVEIVALQILDEAELQHFGVGHDADDVRGNGMKAQFLRRAHAALARDQFEASVHQAPHRDRLDDPFFLDRPLEFLEGLGVKIDAGLVRIRTDPGDLDGRDAARVAVIGRGGRPVRHGRL